MITMMSSYKRIRKFSESGQDKRQPAHFLLLMFISSVTVSKGPFIYPNGDLCFHQCLLDAAHVYTGKRGASNLLHRHIVLAVT